MASRQRKPTYQGRLVREHRRKHGLSYEALCSQMRERIDWACSPATLLNVEHGYVQTPRYKVQQGIAAVLGRDVLDLWPEA